MRACTIHRVSVARASFTCCMTPRNPNFMAACLPIRAFHWLVKLWKHPLKWLGNLAIAGGLVGLFVHYLRFGPKAREEEDLIPPEGAQP